MKSISGRSLSFCFRMKSISGSSIGIVRKTCHIFHLACTISVFPESRIRTRQVQSELASLIKKIGHNIRNPKRYQSGTDWNFIQTNIQVQIEISFKTAFRCRLKFHIKKTFRFILVFINASSVQISDHFQISDWYLGHQETDQHFSSLHHLWWLCSELTIHLFGTWETKYQLQSHQSLGH